MQLFIPITIFVCAALSLTILLKTKPIESLFISIVSFTLLTFLGALVKFLHQTIFIICAFTIILLIYAIWKTIKNKTFKQTILNFITNPALLLLLAVTILNLIIFNHIMLEDTDDFRFWAYAVKVFSAYNGFPHLPYFFTPYQTSGIPIYNTFTTTLATYTETTLIQSQLFFYWVLLTLPLASIKWKKWHQSLPALLYTITLYLLLPRLPEGFTIASTYNDLTISILSATLIAHYLLSKPNKTPHSLPFTTLAGIALLPLVKNGSGLTFALFVISIIYINILLIHPTPWKNKSTHTKIFMIALPFLPFLTYSLHNLGQSNSLIEKREWADPIGSIQNALTTPAGIILFLLFTITLLLSIFFTLKKSNQKNWSWFLFLAAFIALGLFLGDRLDGPTKYLIIVYFKNLLHITFQKNTYRFLTFFILFTIYIALLIFTAKKNFQKSLVIPLTIYLQGMLFIFLILFSYTTFSEWEAYQSASLARYLSGYTNYILILLLIITFIQILPKITKKQPLPSYFLLASTIFFLIISYRNPYDPFHRIQDRINNYETTMQATISEDLSPLIPNLKQDENIFMIAQGDINYPLAKRIAMYTVVPNTLLHTYFTPSNNDSQQQEIEQLKQTLTKENIKYLYIYNLDQHFLNTYAPLFANSSEIQNNQLYQLKENNKTLLFEIITP